MGDSTRRLNQPYSPYDTPMPRCAGIVSFFRLPVQDDNTDGLDACFLGVPFDNGTSNRNGARLGPRSIRNESVLVRTFNQDTGAMPYSSLNVADISDIPLNQYDIHRACADIRTKMAAIIRNGCRPIIAGGDHTISYPILQAFKEKYGPMGLIHLDAHNDTNDAYSGFKITHGTPFRRAVEEGLLDTSRVVQIGLRGSGYSADGWEWGVKQGFKIYPAHQLWHKSLASTMEEVRQIMGPDKPVYISFDIDVLDPAFAPGTGTPEIAGLTTIQALEVIRGCRGLNVVGADLVEVAPPYDNAGMTALTGANLMFEMLCVLPGVKYERTAGTTAGTTA